MFLILPSLYLPILNVILLLLLPTSFSSASSSPDPELQSQDDSLDILSQSRVVRDADSKKEGERKKKRNKNQKEGKKNGKAARKNKKAAKKNRKHIKTTKKNKNSKKNNRKNMKGKNNRKKGKKGKKQRRKNNKTSKTQRKTERQECMAEACVDTTISYMKLLKDKIRNFKVQKARIATSKKQALGKAKKSGLWATVISKIVMAGGGNSSELKCNGASGPGADRLTALHTELTGCEATINATCSTDLPEYNSTMVGMCSDYITNFENLTGAAIEAMGDQACDLWQDPELAMVAASIKMCDISKDNGKFTAQKSKCIKAFGKCRKTEDTVNQAISVCSSSNSQTKILAAITAGVANQAAAADLDKKITAATAAPPARATSTCAAFITAVTEVTNKTMNAPLASGLETMLKAVTALDVSPCSPTEMPSLESAGVAFKAAAGGIDGAVAVKQVELGIITGSTVSTAVNTAAASKARNMKMRAVMGKMFRSSRA